MKMMGMWAERLRPRIIAAVSSPSIPGMLTSRRMTAKSFLSTSRNASSPDFTMTRFWPSSSRIER